MFSIELILKKNRHTLSFCIFFIISIMVQMRTLFIFLMKIAYCYHEQAMLPLCKIKLFFPVINRLNNSQYSFIHNLVDSFLLYIFLKAGICNWSWICISRLHNISHNTILNGRIDVFYSFKTLAIIPS